MDEPIYIIDHMIVMGINVEKTSFLQEKPFKNFCYYILDLSYSKITNNDFSVDFIDIYPLKTQEEIPKYLDNFQNVHKNNIKF